ncbi:MAG: hypothetical protein NTZ47_13995 [Bacteroidetes bacterium]|jgi:hypothetical protein|nr:hypothetical protein [Bacteroidota bacterium]
MKSLNPLSKVLFISLLLGIQVTYAAFTLTGLTDEKSKNAKYSLRTLSNLSNKGLSFSALRYGMPFKGSQTFSFTRQGSLLESNSMMRFGMGNTTYIYSYHVKLKAPKLNKFKTPTTTDIR